MFKLNSIIAGLLCAGLIPTAAFAGAKSGFYVGAGVGESSVGDLDTDLGNVNFSGNDVGWKVFGGYTFGWIPFLDLAVEGGYVDFGKPDDNHVKVSADGWDLFGVVGANIGPVGLFGKIGGISWNADISSTAGNPSDSGTDPVYGIGAKFHIGSFQIRAEYEYFDLSVASNVGLLSASAVWTF